MLNSRLFLFAQHVQTPEGMQESLMPNLREVNTKPRALLATAGSEGRLSKCVVHSASKPKLVR